METKPLTEARAIQPGIRIGQILHFRTRDKDGEEEVHNYLVRADIPEDLYAFNGRSAMVHSGELREATARAERIAEVLSHAGRPEWDDWSGGWRVSVATGGFNHSIVVRTNDRGIWVEGTLIPWEWIEEGRVLK